MCALELFKCTICQEMKLPCSFYRLVRSKISSLTCRKCKNKKNAVHNNSLTGYSSKIFINLLQDVEKYNSSHDQKIIFDIDLHDIIDRYRIQNGLCFVSGVTLTHIFCQEKYMKELYPKNMTVQIQDRNLGYVSKNIILVCISSVSENIQQLFGKKELTDSIVVGENIQQLFGKKELTDSFVVNENIKKSFGNEKSTGYFEKSTDYFEGSTDSFMVDENIQKLLGDNEFVSSLLVDENMDDLGINLC
jgi:hypothetical protein